MQIDVTRAGPSEHETVSTILVEAAAWIAARGESIWELREISPASIHNDVQAGQYFLAWSSDEPVGTLRFTLDDSLVWPEAPHGEAAYVHRLAVRRVVAGRGVSSEMLGWAFMRARRSGCRYLRLDCDAHRSRLRLFYERLGFQLNSLRQTGPFLTARYERQL